jgi:hypothetical protein
MPGSRLQLDLTLAGASGDVFASSTLNAVHADWGQLRTVIARLMTSNYTFTAFELRCCHYPINFVGISLDPQGRPLAAINPFTQPDEQVFYRSGAVAPGAASDTVAFLTENITARRLMTGPVCVGVRWTSSAGNAATIRTMLEAQDTAA